MRLPAKLRVGAPIILCLALLGFTGAPVANATMGTGQRVITLNLHSKYVTSSEATVGLTGSTVADAGPTGLRSWVILPADYSRSRCYPVLYLLHAASTVSEWVDEASLYETLHAVVVVPGGGNSQYTNWWDSGRRRPKWESWFFRELMPEISRRFSICPQRAMHAIAGSSMGGFGALFLASQDPGYFGTAASFSGVIAISNPIIEYNFGDYSTVWGPPGGFYEVGHDPASLVKNLAHTHVFVYVGNGSPLDPQDIDPGDEALTEGVMESEASSFLAAARSSHVPVIFKQHQGIHDQANWDLSLVDFLRAGPFRPVPSHPSNWSYTTVAETGQAWNWEYRFHGEPNGLETLTEHGQTLRGEGTGVVTISGENGTSFTTHMPFEFQGGHLRNPTGAAPGVPVKPATPLLAELRVQPDPVGPTVGLRVTFTTKVRLRRGQEFELDAYQPRATCTLTHAVYFDPKSVRANYTFSVYPGSGNGHIKHKWCRGEGTLALEIVPRRHAGTLVGRLIGRTYFRAS